MSKTTLWNLLHAMGFRYKKKAQKRQLYEKPAILASRAEYLRALRRFRSQGCPVACLDETWCNEHHSVTRAWTDGEVGLDDAPLGKGKRLIILHAGSDQGWFLAPSLFFKVRKAREIIMMR